MSSEFLLDQSIKTVAVQTNCSRNDFNEDVNVTVIRSPGWSNGYDARLDSERLGFDFPTLRHNFFRIADHHLFDPLLDLVANVSSESKMHEDMLSPWRVVCDQVSSVVWQVNIKRQGFHPR